MSILRSIRILTTSTAVLLISTAAAFTKPATVSLRTQSINPNEPIITGAHLSAYRERSNSSAQRKNNNNARSNNRSGQRTNRRDDSGMGDAFGDFDDEYHGDYDVAFEDDDDDDDDLYLTPKSTTNNNNNAGAGAPTTTVQSSTFYSQKSLTDPSFTLTNPQQSGQNQQFFQQLCRAAKITRPSRIQSLAWPPLLRGENAIVADQTGSGKTLAYLLPLLQKLHRMDELDESATQRKKKRTGSPRILVLTPTAELADQIHSVCSALGKSLESTSWSFNPFVTTATGSHSTNIRDQIRLLQSNPVDVLISTPGRLSTILRTKNAGLDLGHVRSLVLDEVDFLLVDETFGPQLRTVGVAVNSGNDEDGEEGGDGNGGNGPQFIFVTATLPEDVLESIQQEFSNVIQLRGPGLHRITPTVRQTLVDVSVPPSSNRDKRAGFDIKVRELNKALRGRRCKRTLVFCNTVETCRNVENVLRRKDRGGRRTWVGCYHGALSHDARVKNLRDFSSGNEDDRTERVLVCTDRAARGIDFDSSPVDHVLLFDFPKDPAEYVRRVGRTARAGREGASTVLAYGWQLPVARQIMGLAGGGKGKGKNKKGKRGNAKLESFTMMKSSDGWDAEDEEDEYYIKGGARRRKEIAASGGGGKKKARKKSNEKQGRTWKK